MATALAIVKNAMRSASGLLSSGASPTTDEQTDYLELLNTLIDQLNAQRLFIFRVQEESFAWGASTASKTIGVGADFVSVRPVKVEGATWRSSANLDTPLSVINWDSHDRVLDRTTGTSVFPERLFYDPAYPLGVLYLTPIPSEAGTILLRTWSVLSSFALISTDVAFPPGYRRFLELYLATQIARENGMPVSPDLVDDLRVARGIVRSTNNKTKMLQLPVELVGAGRYDIYKG